MRMLMNVKFPNREFNESVKNGSCSKIMNRILEECHPEAVYFTEQDGHRSAIVIVDLADPSKVVSLAEPWFLNFNASVEFRIVMSSEELRRSGLEDIGRKWGELGLTGERSEFGSSTAGRSSEFGSSKGRDILR